MAFCLKRLKPKISDLQFHSVLNVGDPTLSFISPRRNEGFSRRRRNSKGLGGGMFRCSFTQQILRASSMCPGEVGLENWKMSLTWSRVKFRLQNRLTGFLLSTVGRGLVGIPLRLLGFAASVGHLSTLKTRPALSVSAPPGEAQEIQISQYQ